MTHVVFCKIQSLTAFWTEGLSSPWAIVWRPPLVPFHLGPPMKLLTIWQLVASEWEGKSRVPAKWKSQSFVTWPHMWHAVITVAIFCSLEWIARFGPHSREGNYIRVQIGGLFVDGESRQKCRTILCHPVVAPVDFHVITVPTRTDYMVPHFDQLLRPCGLSGKECHNRLVMSAMGETWENGSRSPHIVEPHSNSVKASLPGPNRHNNFSLALIRGNDELAKIHISDSWGWMCSDQMAQLELLLTTDALSYWLLFLNTCPHPYWTILYICIQFPTTNIVKKWSKAYLFWFLV